VTTRPEHAGAALDARPERVGNALAARSRAASEPRANCDKLPRSLLRGE
jgi:hypothetical protein